MEEEEEVGEEGLGGGGGVSQQVMKAPQRLRMEWEDLGEMKSGDSGGGGGRGRMALQRLGSPREKPGGVVDTTRGPLTDGWGAKSGDPSRPGCPE